MRVQMIVCLVIPLAIALLEYWIKKDTRNGLWVRVMEQYMITEDYKKFLAVKDCIMSYEYSEDGNERCDVIENVNFVEATIERDKSESVIVPIFITACIAILWGNDSIRFDYVIDMSIALLLLLSVMELLYQLPRNAFIKKVTTSIREELKEEDVNVVVK